MAGTSIATAYIDIVPTVQGLQGNLAGAFQPAEREAEAAGGRSGKKFALVAAGAIAAGGAVVGGALKKLYDVGSVFDDVSDSIRVGTGKSGAALKELESQASAVATSIPTSFEAAGATITQVTQRLGLSGDQLTQVSKQFLAAGNILGEDVDIESASKALSAFGVTGDAVSGQLDSLFRVSQSTGVGMNELTSAASAQAPALQALGFNLDQTVGLIGGLEKAGLNSTAVTASMGKALVTLAKDGEAPQEAFHRITGQIGEMVASGDQAAAIDLASGIFGTKGATQFVAAVQSGTVNMDELSAAAVGTGDTILGLQEETADAAESWQLLKNKGLAALKPMGDAVFGFVGGAMAKLAESFDPAMAKADELWAGLTMDATTRAEFDGQTSGLVKFGSSVREVFDGVAAVVGPMFQQTFDMVVPIFKEVGAILGPAFVQVFETLKPAVQQLLPIVTQLLPVFNPVGLLFKALLPVLPQLAKILGDLGKVLAEGIARALQAVAPLFETLVGVINRLMPFVTKLITSLLPPLAGLFDKLAPLIDAILDALIPVIDAIVAALIPAIDALMPVVERVFTFIADTIGNVVTVIGGVIDFITGIFTGNWELVWTGVQEIFGGVWDQIKNIFSTAWDVIFELFTNVGPKLWEILTGLASQLDAWGRQFIGWIWDGIKALWTDVVWPWFASLPGMAWDAIKAAAGWLGERGAEFVSWIWQGSDGNGGIVGMWNSVVQWFAAAPGNLWRNVSGAWQAAVEWGADLVTWIWEGTDGNGGIVGVFRSVVDYFVNWPRNAWANISGAWAAVVQWGADLISWIWQGTDGNGGIKGGAVAIFSWFTGGLNEPNSLLGGIWSGLQALISKFGEMGGKLVEWIVDGIKGAAQKVADAVTGLFSLELNDEGTGYVNVGVVPGGARGAVVPGRDPGRRDNVLGRLPNGAAFGLRSREAIMVPEFTNAVGGESGVHRLNRLAEQGALNVGFARGGVLDEAKLLGAQAAEGIAKSIGADGPGLWDFIGDHVRAAFGKSMGGLFGGADPDSARGRFLAAMQSKMGTSYVWGAAGPNVFDCSGLISWALQQAGVGKGRLTAEGFNSTFPKSGEAPGNLVTFDTGRIPGRAGHIGAIVDVARGLMMHTDGAGPARISDYKSRDGGPLNIVDAIGGSAGGGSAAVFTGILSKVVGGIAGRFNNAVGASGETPGGVGVDRWRPIVLQALARTGQAASWADAVLKQMNSESSGNPQAINNWDSNAMRGTPSKGLMQMIDPTFQRYRDPGLINDIWAPPANVTAAIRYVLGTYPEGLARFNHAQAYDGGGMFAPGTVGVNLLSKPEAVLTPAQSDAYQAHARALEAGYSGRAPNVQVFIGDRELTDIVDVRVDGKLTQVRQSLVTEAIRG